MNKGRQHGFTVLEVLVALGLLGLLMPAIASMLRQSVIQMDRNTTRITALTPLENTGRWLGRDIPLAQDADLVDGAPAVTQMILYWTDWSDSGNYDQYSASGAAYKRVRATYTLSGEILTRTMATCANQLDTDALCTSQVVSGADWTDNTKWVSGQTVLTSSGTFNSASRVADSASPLPVARDITTFQVSRTGSAVTVAVASSPKGAASPTESRTYLVYASLLGVGDPIQ